MATKKRRRRRYRLNPKFTRFLIYASVFIALIIYGYNGITSAIKEIKYKETNEYKLISLGYSKDETSLLLNNLNEETIVNILNEGKYNELYPNILSQKYYLAKNYEKYITYKEHHEKEPYDKVIAIVNVHANAGWYNEEYETDTNKGYLILVNKFYHLSSDYERVDLQNINLKYAYADNKAAQIVIAAYDTMYNDILNELNIHLMVNSSYRPYKDQEEIYNDYKNISLKYADSYAARPGYSEHQTGLALDITSLEHPNQKSFTESEEYEWLKNNCHKYGFILRYPEGKEDITGYNTESWHFRYVGVDVATQIHNENITFDEYYAYYLDK